MEKDFDINYILGFLARRKWFFVIGTTLGVLTAFCYMRLIAPRALYKSVAEFPAAVSIEPETLKTYKKFAGLAEARAQSVEMTDFIKQAALQSLSPSDHGYYAASSTAPRVAVSWAETTNSLNLTLTTPTPLSPHTANSIMQATFLKLIESVEKDLKSDQINSPAQTNASSSRDFINTELAILKLIEEANLERDARRIHLDEVHKGNILYSAAKDLVLLEKNGKISRAEADVFLKKLYSNQSAFAVSTPAKSAFDGMNAEHLPIFKKAMLDHYNIKVTNELTPIDSRDRRIKGSIIMAFIFLGFVFLAVWTEFASLHNKKLSNFILNPKQQ